MDTRSRREKGAHKPPTIYFKIRNVRSGVEWSSYCGRQTVGQFVWVSGLPLGPLTRFYLVLFFSADNYLIILSKASSLTRKRVCSLQWNHSLVPITILYCERAVIEKHSSLPPSKQATKNGTGIDPTQNAENPEFIIVLFTGKLDII
jgi:hypothetical protein